MGAECGVYILYSQTADRYYVGQTSGLQERVRWHLAGSTQVTKSATDWMLVLFEPTVTLLQALALERQIKKMKSRKSISRYIKDKRNLAREPIPLVDIASGRSAAW